MDYFETSRLISSLTMSPILLSSNSKQLVLNKLTNPMLLLSVPELLEGWKMPWYRELRGVVGVDSFSSGAPTEGYLRPATGNSMCDPLAAL